MRSRLVSTAVGGLALALAGPASAQTVHIVAGDGTGDFLELQDAVDAAVNGDVLLVRPHATPYLPTVINGKGLAIVGEGDGRPRVDEMAIRNLPADQVLTLRNLFIEGSETPLFGGADWELNDGMFLTFNDGCVWFEDVVLAGDHGWHNWGDLGFGRTGLIAGANDCVIFVNSEVRGGAGGLSTGATPYPGGLAAQFVNSRVALHGTTVAGGQGMDGFFGAGQYAEVGGVALDLTSTLLFASGSTIAGGDTGLGTVTSPVPTSPGLVLRDASVMHLVGSTVEAGGGDAPPGVALEETGVPSDLVDLGGDGRRLSLPATLREGVPSLMTYAGVPGDLVLMQASFSPDFVPLYAALRGVLHRGPVVAEAIVGVAGPPLGGFTSFLLGPDLPVGVDAQRVFTQPVILTPDGDLRLGGPSTIVLLDAAVPTP